MSWRVRFIWIIDHIDPRVEKNIIDGVTFVWSSMASISTSNSSVKLNFCSGFSVKLRKMINNFAKKGEKESEKKKTNKQTHKQTTSSLTTSNGLWTTAYSQVLSHHCLTHKLLPAVFPSWASSLLFNQPGELRLLCYWHRTARRPDLHRTITRRSF